MLTKIQALLAMMPSILQVVSGIIALFGNEPAVQPTVQALALQAVSEHPAVAAAPPDVQAAVKTLTTHLVNELQGDTIS